MNIYFFHSTSVDHPQPFVVDAERTHERCFTWLVVEIRAWSRHCRQRDASNPHQSRSGARGCARKGQVISGASRHKKLSSSISDAPYVRPQAADGQRIAPVTIPMLHANPTLGQSLSRTRKGLCSSMGDPRQAELAANS